MMSFNRNVIVLLNILSLGLCSIPTLQPSPFPSSLFAIVGGAGCAETVSFGPQVLTTSSANFFSTSVGLVPHQQWLQIVTSDGTTELFRIYWTFDTAKSVPDRFYGAVSFGESVSYRVVLANTGQEYFYNGLWRFSKSASIASPKLNVGGTTCCLSADDGAWGAGNGELDADTGPTSPGGVFFWGIGNWGSSDSGQCEKIYQNGVVTLTTASNKSFMYVAENTPTRQPTSQPSLQPTNQPSSQPSQQPSGQPSTRPSNQPTSQPSQQPTGQPTAQPSQQPTGQPSTRPSNQPTSQPSQQPSGQPSRQPSNQPTSQPSKQPTGQPTSQPCRQPSSQPSRQPSSRPSNQPSIQPSFQPSMQPSSQPIVRPSSQPSQHPTVQPTNQPSRIPTCQPSAQPSEQPSVMPSAQPSAQPSAIPTEQPTSQPTAQPSALPSTQPSLQPSMQPTSAPTCEPSAQPSRRPSAQPVSQPTSQPTYEPSAQPSQQPSRQPASDPTGHPSIYPTMQPSALPSTQPVAEPSGQPTSQPSLQPSALPSVQPSETPTTQPSGQPSRQPASSPTLQPSLQPSAQPTTRPSTPSLFHGNWEAPLVETDAVSGIYSVNDNIWACGRLNVSLLCDLRNATSGATSAKYTLPWKVVTDVIPSGVVSNVVLVGAHALSSDSAASDVALCQVEYSQMTCSVMSFQETTFTAISYTPFPNKIVLVGSYRSGTTVVVLDLERNAADTFTYRVPSSSAVTLSHAQSPPNYVGSFLSGTSVSAVGNVNSIIAGVVRTDSGKMTLLSVVPIRGTIVNRAELVNAMALEDTKPDSFIVGGLQLSGDAVMHAYLLRANALFGAVIYGTRYQATSSVANHSFPTTAGRRALRDVGLYSTVTKGITCIADSLYMIVDVRRFTTNSTSVIVMHTDMQTGLILRQVHLTTRNGSLSCTNITSTGLFITIACQAAHNTTTKLSVLINTDLQLMFARLPFGLIKKPSVVLLEETIPFQRFALSVSTTKALSAISRYNYSSTNGVQTFPPSLAPSPQPSSQPSAQPSRAPSNQPSSSPTAAPSVSPQPTSHPSSSTPTNTNKPTVKPTQQPSAVPSKLPTILPTLNPSGAPTARPTLQPSKRPSIQPSVVPTPIPTLTKTKKPTYISTPSPSLRNSDAPSPSPSSMAATRDHTTQQNPRLALLIVGDIVGALLLLWCGYRAYKWYIYRLNEIQKVRQNHEIMNQGRLLLAAQPPHGIHLPSRMTKYKGVVHTNNKDGAVVNGAFADGGTKTINDKGASCNNSTPNSVYFEDSESVVLSSLHSSEMSHVEWSENINGSHSQLFQIFRSSENVMEEGYNGPPSEEDMYSSPSSLTNSDSYCTELATSSDNSKSYASSASSSIVID